MLSTASDAELWRLHNAEIVSFCNGVKSFGAEFISTLYSAEIDRRLAERAALQQANERMVAAIAQYQRVFRFGPTVDQLADARVALFAVLDAAGTEP